MWTWWEAWLVVGPAAMLGGAINSIAGGGTLLTFPALLWVLGTTDAASIVANGTNTMAMCPSSLASAWGYRREIGSIRRWIWPLAWPSLLGGILGTLLVVALPGKVFRTLVPWLILTATVLLILQPRLTRTTSHFATPPKSLGWVVALQLAIGIYGGYFGAGIGILMLSSLSLLGIGDIHHVNGLKTILAGLINSASVAVFLYSGQIDWQLAPPMVVCGMIGGWMGASVARRLDRVVVRRSVIAIGLGLSAWYFAVR